MFNLKLIEVAFFLLTHLLFLFLEVRNYSTMKHSYFLILFIIWTSFNSFSQEQEIQSAQTQKYQVKLLTGLTKSFTYGLRGMFDNDDNHSFWPKDNYSEIDANFGARFGIPWGYVSIYGVYKYSVTNTSEVYPNQLRFHHLGGALKYTLKKNDMRFKPFLTFAVLTEVGNEKYNEPKYGYSSVGGSSTFNLSDKSYIFNFSAGCEIRLAKHFNLSISSGYNYRVMKRLPNYFKEIKNYHVRGVSFHLGLAYAIPLGRIKKTI